MGKGFLREKVLALRSHNPMTTKKAVHFLCILSGEMADTKFRQRIVYSADLCYNDMGDENG